MAIASVTIPVPEELTGPFLEYVGRWLTERRCVVGEMTPDDDTLERDWGRDDLPVAIDVYGRFTETAQKIFDLLIDADEDGVSSDTIAKKIGLTGPSSVSGALAWPGRHCYNAGRKYPVAWRDTEKETIYYLEPDVKDLFRKARDASGNKRR